MCKIVLISLSGRVKHDLTPADLSYKEALNYCEEHNWELIDENEIPWNLGIQHVYNEPEIGSTELYEEGDIYDDN